MLDLQKDIVKKGATIIEGFPGFGLVATIATEYLVQNLKFERIGMIVNDKLMPVVAIQDEKLFRPFPVMYNSEKNMVVIYGLNLSKGLEWEICDDILNFAGKIKAKRLICLEGLFNPQAEESNVLYYTNDAEMKEKLKHLQVMKNGIILGVTSAVLIKNKKHNVTCLFGETHSNIPDSIASAKVIDVLNKTLSLNIDIKPLFKQAKDFESKLKEVITKSNEVSRQKELKDDLSYIN
ncbi:MAG TPA: proteasome assembly chaperone family protein [Candidatus Woesearchaeota archaeon]|nr:proteasome assembly chaperone family protein [Candidatus Woesearchaeota archaeon]